MQRSLFNMRRLAVLPSVRPVYRSSVRMNRFYSAEAEEKPVETEKPQVSAEAQELEKLKQKYEAKDKELAEWKQKYSATILDFKTLQETTKKDVQKAKDFALQKFAKDLIETVDNFGHALRAVNPATLDSNKEVALLYEGVDMTRNVLEKTLARHGLEKIDPLGEQFDPNFHEATFEVPHPEKEAGSVLMVQQPGYHLNGRVLRPAKVGLVKSAE